MDLALQRRAERIDSARSLDILADLSLGQSDDEADDNDDVPGGADHIVREGISQFATMLPPPPPPVPTSSTSSESAQPPAPESSMQTQERKRGKNKRKGKSRASQADGSRSQGASGQSAPTKSKGKGGKNAKPSKWADKCMYAELLEMKEGFDACGDMHDGIPQDIETGWVAVTPIPVGKRCLAVTHQASGVAGVGTSRSNIRGWKSSLMPLLVPNTTLRSRVLGKPLMKPFPSVLPPQTVLDCILDEHWRDNGILHILDVISWKGQDLGDCETPFRFAYLSPEMSLF